jgi:hypothetical protein
LRKTAAPVIWTVAGKDNLLFLATASPGAIMAAKVQAAVWMDQARDTAMLRFVTAALQLVPT